MPIRIDVRFLPLHRAVLDAGDIIYMRAFGNSIMVLNSAKVADDLLDKRGAIYSSRPERAMVRDVMGWTWSFAGMPYGNSWRKHRGVFQKHFHARATPRYEPIQIREAHALLRNLLRSPENYYHHARRYRFRSAAALVMKISYGHDVAEEGDIFVILAERAMSNLIKASIFGTYLVDYIPILKYVPQWFPGAEFKRQGKKWMKDSQAMLDEPYKVVKAQMASGIVEPSVMTIELGSSNDSKEVDITLIKNIAAISYAAGADTTVATLMTFFLTMLLHPEVQHKAQEEIDRVVGPDRLPEFSDRDNCHMAMFHDEAKYPDAFAFRPERFEDQKKNTELGINDLPHIVFGFGRRICPGRWLALDSLWITIASLLSVYNISKSRDTNGAVIEPEVEFVSAFVSQPKRFKCSLVPRSETALALINQTEDEKDRAKQFSFLSASLSAVSQSVAISGYRAPVDIGHTIENASATLALTFFRTRRRGNFDEYTKLHDPNYEPPFVCDVSGRSQRFTRDWDLKRHKNGKSPHGPPSRSIRM
ncbi:hypothetical protein EW146_g4040 [Bondarzewia mesenterica]|uniref:Cytochrome P450 n=1 Tax=Bondarzewia mesenterica TaxID=1095465 RepID=A0A4S4LXY6_9AGAM|nr:hypothetical protein EW146_g4040 [Bondarzewia mesenterica]